MKARRADKLARKRQKKLRREKKLEFLQKVEAHARSVIADDFVPWCFCTHCARLGKDCESPLHPRFVCGCGCVAGAFDLSPWRKEEKA